MIDSVDQEYFGPEGHFEIHNSECFDDGKTIEIICDFVGDVEVAQNVLKPDLDRQIVIIKPRKK